MTGLGTFTGRLDVLYKIVTKTRALKTVSHARLPSGEIVELLEREKFRTALIKWCVKHDDRRVRVYPIDDLPPITALQALAEQAD